MGKTGIIACSTKIRGKNTYYFLIFALICIIFFASVFSCSKAYASYADYNYDGTVACTIYAWRYAQSRGYYFSDNWGDGGDWFANASAEGYATDGNPSIDSIACWSKEDTPQHGHVAYVIGVGDNYIDITEGGSHWSGASAEGICNRRIYTWSTYQGKSIWPDQGFIHLSSPTISFRYENYDKFYELTETSAHFGVKIYGSVGSATAVGCELFNANKSLLGSCQDGAYREGDCLIHHFIFQAGSPDINIALSPGTSYYYRYHVVANGQAYYSDYYPFSTLGQTQIEFSFVNNEAYYELGPYSAHFGTKIYGSIGSATNVGCILYDSAKNVLGSCQDNAWKQEDYLIHHYYFQDGSPDINITLVPGTTYYFQYYVVAGGERYYSELYSFRTLGTTITVFYDANGGSNPPANQTFSSTTSTATATVSSSLPSNPGFSFLGWSEQRNAAQPTYQPGATVTRSTDLTLYAVWETTAQVQWQNLCCYPSKKSAYISATVVSSVSGVFSETEIKVWDSNGNLIAEKTETGSGSRLQLPVWYELYSETGAVLQSGNQYTYQLSAVFNGKPFESSLYRFTTETSVDHHFGIDVSQAQGNIDWDTVSQYIDFAIIRCGFGGDYTVNDDTQWANNVAACERLGIPYGVFIYSYAENDAEALGEAEHVLRLLSGHQPSLPVYYDLEDANTVGHLSNEQIASQITVFTNRIRKAGYKVGVYANDNWWSSHLSAAAINDDSKWFAGWSGVYAPRICNYALWQFTSDGSVPGINGRVDLDYSYLYQFGTIESTEPEVAEPDFVLPASLTVVDDEAFLGCAFSYVKLAETTTKIGVRAFANCANLAHIYIPEATTSISTYAFENVENLTIHGIEGSYAEFFAQRKGFAFVAE